MTYPQRLPLLLVLVSLACTPTGGPEAAPTPVVPSAPAEPALTDGQLTAADEIAGRGFLQAATSAAAAGDWPEAARTAGQVVEQYPSLPGSFRALRILARASYETGDFATARGAAARVLDFPGETGEWVDESRLILGSSALAEGDTLAAMTELMRISAGASEEVVGQALDQVRPVAANLGAEDLSGLLSGAGSAGPVSPPVQVEYGVALYFQGASDAAADLGRAALAAGAVGREEELALALVSGRVEEALGGERTIGALLPSSGPPTLTRFGALLEEGVRIALEEQRTLDRRPVQVLIEDDGGSVSNLERLVPDLEAQGVTAIIGPLLDDAVAAAGTLRQRDFPIVSPTARDIPTGMRGVYSLMGPDPSGPRALADWAARNGLGRVVIMHPTEPASSYEAQVFRDQFTQAGGQVLDELLFPVGATFFEELLRQVEELAPDALVLPLQAPAIELVAPQVTFYGLDTLGIQVLGTDAWTSDAVLQTIDPRHTNGVIASTTLPGGLPSPAAQRFRERYEEIHRQTLRSEVPALGYDAAGIILEGLRAGASSGEDLLAFLETLDGFEGATGRLSVQDGRLVRSHYLVRLENRSMLPVF